MGSVELRTDIIPSAFLSILQATLLLSWTEFRKKRHGRVQTKDVSATHTLARSRELRNGCRNIN
jgi:hypothetical protein